MDERMRTLDNARTRYLISEISEDLTRALQRQDYKDAVDCARSMYDLTFRLYEQEGDDEKEANKSKLEKLSELIDKINERLNFGDVNNGPN